MATQGTGESGSREQGGNANRLLSVDRIPRTIGSRGDLGLCGHTVIALLDALREEPNPVHHHPARTGRRARRRWVRKSYREGRGGFGPSGARSYECNQVAGSLRWTRCPWWFLRATFPATITGGIRTRKLTCTRMRIKARCTGHSANVSIELIASRIYRASWNGHSILPRPDGRALCWSTSRWISYLPTCR